MTDDEPAVDLLVVIASVADAEALAPLGRPHRHHAPRATLVATGPAPMVVDLALDDAGAPAARTLIVDGDPPAGPVGEVALLLPRMDELIAETCPEGVVVRGGSPAALAAAQCAAWRGVPVLHLPVAGEHDVAAISQQAIEALAHRSERRVGEELAEAVRRLPVSSGGLLGGTFPGGTFPGGSCSGLTA